MKTTTTTCISALIGAVLVASVTQAANMPTVPAPPGPPATFKRESRELPFEQERCDKDEIGERDTNKPRLPMGEPVICRKACPEGYGVAKDKCVWNENFVPHTRSLKAQGDGCYDNEIKDEARAGGVMRRVCRASCPWASLGWLAIQGECLYKPKEYSSKVPKGRFPCSYGRRRWCFTHWECIEGYTPKPGDPSICIRKASS